MKNPEISVVIPTYNEREGCIYFLRTLITELKKTRRSFEIIVIDDDSPDQTGKIIQQTFRGDVRIRCYIRFRDRGLGKSILLGIRKARGEILIGMDADFNHDPGTLPSLISCLSDADFVIASRFIAGGGMEGRGRYWLSRAFNWFLQVFFRFPVSDNTSGYYAIRRDLLMTLGPAKIYRGYGDYHLRLVQSAYTHQLKIREVPVWYPARLYGQSKSKLLTMAASYLFTAHRLRRRTS